MSLNTELKTSSTAQPQTQGGSVAKNALKMTFGTMTSRILGLLREVLFAALFEKFVTDSWTAAFRVPNLFRRLLGEGSLSVSFIPVFIEAQVDQNQSDRARNLVNATYTVLLILLSGIVALGLIYPDAILSWVLDPSYIAQAEKYALTVRLAKIMFLFVFFISSFAFFMGILNAVGEFFWPALAPTLWNIAMVISTLLPGEWLNRFGLQNGDQLAWGVVIGGALQAGILIPQLIKKGYFPKMSWDIANQDMRRVFKNMIPGLMGMGLLQFTTLLNLRFSSSLAEGTISYINYIDRLIELPLSLISVSLGTALLPSLSRLWVTDQKKEMSDQSRRFLEINILISLLGACVLFGLSEPIVKMLFGRGRFTDYDVHICAQILKTYCWVLLFSSAVRVLTPAYYAVKNTWFPAVCSGISLVVHFFLAPKLMALYQVQGLMLSTIFTAFLNMVLLLGFYNQLITTFNFNQFFKTLIKYVVIGLLVYVSTFVFTFFPDTMKSGTIHLVVSLGITFLVVITVFVASCKVMKIDGVDPIINKIKSRF